MITVEKEKEISFWHQYFSDRYNNHTPQLNQKEIQNKLIKASSILMLDFFQNLDPSYQQQIFERIKLLHETYNCFLDSSHDEFLNGVKTNFTSRVFELIIANLVTKAGYTLTHHESLKSTSKNKISSPDLWTKDFFIECRCNNSSFLYDWDKFLPKLDDLNILPSKEKKTLLELNGYILNFFKDYIPQKILEKLKELQKTSYFSDRNEEFISKRIMQSIVDKIKKPYFQKNRGLIAINTAFLVQGLHLNDQETKKLIDIFLLQKETLLQNEMEKFSPSEQTEIQTGLKNLIGIILDTNWYNWFPDIRKQNGDHSQSFQDNLYYLLYFPIAKDYNLSGFKSVIKYHKEIGL